MSGEKEDPSDPDIEEAVKKVKYDPNNYFIDCGDVLAAEIPSSGLSGELALGEPYFVESFSHPTGDQYSLSPQPKSFPGHGVFRTLPGYHLNAPAPEFLSNFTSDHSFAFSGDWTLFSQPSFPLSVSLGSVDESVERKETKNNPRCMHGKIKYVCKGT